MSEKKDSPKINHTNVYPSLDSNLDFPPLPKEITDAANKPNTIIIPGLDSNLDYEEMDKSEFN